MKKDVLERVFKTVVEAFLGALIPEVVCILTNISNYSFNDIQVWLLPIVSAALAAAISAGWNTYQNYKANKEHENDS